MSKKLRLSAKMSALLSQIDMEWTDINIWERETADKLYERKLIEFRFEGPSTLARRIQ